MSKKREAASVVDAYKYRRHKRRRVEKDKKEKEDWKEEVKDAPDTLRIAVGRVYTAALNLKGKGPDVDRVVITAGDLVDFIRDAMPCCNICGVSVADVVTHSDDTCICHESCTYTCDLD